MEILKGFKQNGYFTAELYNMLAQKKWSTPIHPIKPSEYLKEMSLSTVERLQTLKDIQINNIVSCCEEKKLEPAVTITPNIIIFQNFKQNDKIVAKFTVKNITTESVYINMVYKESPYFFIKFSGSRLLSRLAPGISLPFTITFMPASYEDMAHRVTFTTDKYQYVLPIIAIGPRVIFDFPDEATLPATPIKVESSISTSIVNVGSASGAVTLRTRSPFSVFPKSLFLSPGERADVKINFKTMHLGESQGIIYALFETGETFVINVKGYAHSVSIELERDVVRFPDTFNTMRRQQVYKITNKSTEVLTFMCMKNNSINDDFYEKRSLTKKFRDLKDVEIKKDSKLVYYDVLSSEIHSRVYTRIYYDEVQALVADESLHFQTTHFSIEPIKGELWPNKATELTITFSPQAVGDFEEIAYLDLDGISDRVLLKMIGTSLPPLLQLNIETLDMDRIYINKVYNYEIVVSNKGDINGVILRKEHPVLFGSNITCSPDLICLKPGEKDIFVLSFSNSSQGPFFEEVRFMIRETDVVLRLYLKGEIIYPTLTFSTPCLDFGNVSIGIPKTMIVDVINECEAQVTASLKISGDGPEVNSIMLKDYAVMETPKPIAPEWPREFSIEPSEICLNPVSRISLEITLIANLIRANQTSLEMELGKSDSPPIALPVTYNAMIPDITPAPDLRLPVCFVDYTYDYDIVFQTNDVWGYFTIEELEDPPPLQVNVQIKEGYLEPNSTVHLPIKIRTDVVGTFQYPLRLLLFGALQPVEICHITATGALPVVTCSPLSLFWGQVQLLRKWLKCLVICNDSPCTIYFKATLLNRDTKWEIEPSVGYLPPDSDTNFIVTLYMVDAVSASNKLVINLNNEKEMFIPLSATGIGTSIVVGDLEDRVELGRHFTKLPLKCKVVMENRGTRMHVLEWTYQQRSNKSVKTSDKPSFFFDVQPRQIRLGSGEMLELSITAFTSKPITIQEHWYLIGAIEGINKKEMLLACPITAEFVDPKVDLSPPLVEFHYYYGPYSEHYKLLDIVKIKNISKLPINLEISVRLPFSIIEKNEGYKILSHEEDDCHCIKYLPSKYNINDSCDTGGKTVKTPIDYLTLQPVAPLREGSLDFFEDINKIKETFSLTQGIEQQLEDNEVIIIQLVFDITKHTSLKCKIYTDILRIKYKDLKKKDSVKLTGYINYPNMQITSQKIDFQCILNQTIESKILQVRNVTPLKDCYRFVWKKCVITSIPCVKSIETLPPVESERKYDISDIVLTVEEEEGALLPEKIAEIDQQTPVDTRRDSTFIEILEVESLTNNENLTQKTIEIENLVEPMEIRVLKKVMPMLDGDCGTSIEFTSKFPKLDENHPLNFNEVFSLIPHRGILKSDEAQNIQVVFDPPRNIDAKAVLECQVLGGHSEWIVISGQSSDLQFAIDTYKVNFKIRPFHIKASEKIHLTNKALLIFEYRTYLNEPVNDNELEGIILSLDPPDKVLEAQETIELNVVVRPGVVGYFNRTFLIEVGHFPAVPINVFGWGSISQVYIAKQKHDLSLLPDELSYLAIALLTTEYLEAVNEFFTYNISDGGTSTTFDKRFEDPQMQDWEVIYSWEGIPSETDVELALERYLVTNHIKLHPEILNLYTTAMRIGPIPNFYTMPCTIDYGVVMTGSATHYTTDVINYGPLNAKIDFAKNCVIPEWLQFKLPGKLSPGESGKLEVTFTPTADIFTEPEQKYAENFYVEVHHGVTIPIVVKALCAVPYLVTNITSINFGNVRCGDKAVISIPLKNIGKPTCIWYVTLKAKYSGTNPITLEESSGSYEPGQGGWFKVAFKPSMETEMSKTSGLLQKLRLS